MKPKTIESIFNTALGIDEEGKYGDGSMGQALINRHKLHLRGMDLKVEVNSRNVGGFPAWIRVEHIPTSIKASEEAKYSREPSVFLMERALISLDKIVRKRK